MSKHRYNSFCTVLFPSYALKTNTYHTYLIWAVGWIVFPTISVATDKSFYAAKAHTGAKKLKLKVPLWTIMSTVPPSVGFKQFCLKLYKLWNSNCCLRAPNMQLCYFWCIINEEQLLSLCAKSGTSQQIQLPQTRTTMMNGLNNKMMLLLFYVIITQNCWHDRKFYFTLLNIKNNEKWALIQSPALNEKRYFSHLTAKWNQPKLWEFLSTKPIISVAHSTADSFLWFSLNGKQKACCLLWNLLNLLHVLYQSQGSSLWSNFDHFNFWSNNYLAGNVENHLLL